jgi:pimeloyl-ACP methyl ester carboxylesterase
MPADRLVYLFGLAGHPGLSPAMAQLAADGWDVVVPELPGFDGRSGFVQPDEHLDWIRIYWDALDATGALPCPVVGACLGGMMAAELAALRPEAVTHLALLGPFGIYDTAHPGLDIYALPAAQRLGHVFAKAVPEAFGSRFAGLGADEAPVALYLSDMAAASMLWPFGDRGLRKRIHRIRAPKLVLWGASDELLPPAVGEHWGGAEVVAGAGHLLEWDAPDEVAARLRAFLPGVRS